MASAPPITVFKKGDYGSDGLGSQDALDKFFPQLNSWLAVARAALAGGLTSDNTLSEVKTFNVTTPATDWINATLNADWSAVAVGEYPTLRYRKDDRGLVSVEGLVKSASNTSGGNAITQLPAGYYPDLSQRWATSGFGTGVTTDSFDAITMCGQHSAAPPGTLQWTGGTAANSNLAVQIHFYCADRSPGVLSCFPLTVATKVTSPRRVSVMQVLDLSTTPQTMALGNLDWTRQNGSVRINNLPGLLLGKTYRLTLLIEG